MGHFDEKHYRLLKAIHAVGGVACESFPELFFPDDISDPAKRRVASAVAKKMCFRCPVQKECFRYAVESGQKHGIWGGTSPSER
jgi:WhiB family transcriptional regulator, redox-sensing transcriptional regulator